LLASPPIKHLRLNLEGKGRNPPEKIKTAIHHGIMKRWYQLKSWTSRQHQSVYFFKFYFMISLSGFLCCVCVIVEGLFTRASAQCVLISSPWRRREMRKIYEPHIYQIGSPYRAIKIHSPSADRPSSSTFSEANISVGFDPPPPAPLSLGMKAK
jgi:hypothetical protein